MADASLAEQVTYPQKVEMTPEMSKKLEELLDLVGVGCRFYVKLLRDTNNILINMSFLNFHCLL